MTVLALPLLVEAVVARFASDGTEATNVFGWREPAKRPASYPRIVWVPGDDGDVGKLGPARQPGRNPRPLATLGELVTVYLEAVDASAHEDELAQYSAARLLFDAWWRAVYLARRGTVTIESLRWVDGRKERRFGAALRVVLNVEAVIPDEEHPLASTDARAVVDGALLDVEEQWETAPAPPSARAATTSAITLAGEQTIDGVAVVAGNRVLVRDQTAAEENGIYVAAAGAWSRAGDVLEHGFFVHVESGTVNGAAGFELTTADPIVIDTTALVFERVSP